jgi:hypothetical protein
VLAPVLVVLSVWLYTLVFAFASLWFAHFALAALQQLRLQAAIDQQPQPQPAQVPASVTPPALEGGTPMALPPP